jgi:hypothetical protein
MRQIKFRGRSLKTGKYMYGSLVTTDANPNIMMIDISDDQDDMYHEIEYVDPETVGQFTGLYDFKGHPIYEGDKILGRSGGNFGTVCFYEYRFILAYGIVARPLHARNIKRYRLEVQE